MAVSLIGRDFLKIADFTKEELLYLLDVAAFLKKANKSGTEQKIYAGQKNCAHF